MTDDGELVWYNPATQSYQFIHEQPSPVVTTVDIRGECESPKPSTPAIISERNNIWDRPRTLLLLEKCTNKKTTVG
ncbi:hypothetical protein MTP99_003779 [Tenebrio molitor]|nr:hypothetical protein MTP99_003779 [Tenebrio molitor]